MHIRAREWIKVTECDAASPQSSYVCASVASQGSAILYAQGRGIGELIMTA